MSHALRQRLRAAVCAGLFLAGLALGGCEQGRMLREADSQLKVGHYEQALATYKTVRKQTPIQGYRVRADKGIATASQALVGSVRESSLQAAAAGQPGLALLYEARAAQLGGNKDYVPRRSPHAAELLNKAAFKLKVEAMDAASSPMLQLLADRLTSTALLRVTDDAGQAEGLLTLGVIERPLLSDQEAIRKTISYIDKQVPGPNPAYAAQKKRRDLALRQSQAAQEAFHHQQTLQFAGEARVNNGDNVSNSQRRYAWLEAERLRKAADAAQTRLSAEERKLSNTPETIDVPHYEPFIFDAKRYTQDLTGELVLAYRAAGAAEDERYTNPLRVSARDEGYAAQPKVDLLAKGPSLPTLEDMRYTLQQQGVTDALAWLGRLEAQRREQLEANARGTGPLDPTEAAIAVLVSTDGPIPVAEAAALNAQIEQATGIPEANTLLGIEARAPSIVDINPNKPTAE